MRDEVLKSPFIGERSKKLRPILPFSLVAFDPVLIPFRRSTEGKTPISSRRCFVISTVVLSRLISTLQICWLKMNWSPHADEDLIEAGPALCLLQNCSHNIRCFYSLGSCAPKFVEYCYSSNS